MFCKAVLCLSTLHFYSVAAQGECTDLRGRLISNGLHYVPGPDTCTLCVCDGGLPKVCKAVLCSPPQDCRSFRVGTTCCEFICLDDVVKPAEATEANVRVAAGGAAAVVLLTVGLVVYRVRKQKRRRPRHTEDQRSLTSIGVSNETSFHRTYAAAVEARDDVCASHAYVNLPRPIAQIANTQNCYNAPLLQQVHPTEVREATLVPHPLAQNMGGAAGAVMGGARLTGSLGAISARLSVPRDDHERPHNVPGFYTTHTALWEESADGAEGSGWAVRRLLPSGI
ncbi:jg14776 [Pararge aegeria aegeria]|uniref:Jg14776 protein n=1 Tax=Pararge aegeria aegeria TaxID=348720 RepID=A0A8S4SF95_9NEOP|nr:jg14776 [Pararge aegeria aegeria]